MSDDIIFNGLHYQLVVKLRILGANKRDFQNS